MNEYLYLQSAVMDKKDIILTICAAGGAYLLAAKSGQKQIDKQEEKFQARINELNDDVKYEALLCEEQKKDEDPYNFVKPYKFYGELTKWKYGDADVYFYWNVYFKNQSVNKFMVSVTSVSVTLFGVAQETPVTASMLSANSVTSFIVQPGKTFSAYLQNGKQQKLWPKGTIKNNVAAYGEVHKSSIEVSVKYSLQDMNTKQHYPERTVTLKGVDNVSMLFTHE